MIRGLFCLLGILSRNIEEDGAKLIQKGAVKFLPSIVVALTTRQLKKVDMHSFR